jgi:hypothetical protein
MFKIYLGLAHNGYYIINADGRVLAQAKALADCLCKARTNPLFQMFDEAKLIATGDRVLYDSEHDKYYTYAMLEDEFNADNELKETYDNDFQTYILECMCEENGTLEII